MLDCYQLCLHTWVVDVQSHIMHLFTVNSMLIRHLSGASLKMLNWPTGWGENPVCQQLIQLPGSVPVDCHHSKIFIIIHELNFLYVGDNYDDATCRS